MAASRRGSMENSFSRKQDLVKAKVKEEPVPNKEEGVKEEKPEEIKTEPVKKEIQSEKTPVKEKPKKNKPSNDTLFSVAEKKHGVQRSIYFESANFEYCEALAKKYNAQLSKIVNIIIAQHIENEKGE